MSLRRSIVIAAMTALFALAVWLHVPGVNGPPYWLWRWTSRPNVAAIVVTFTLCAVPALLALTAARGRHALAVMLAAMSAVALQIAAASLAGKPIEQRLAVIVTDPATTSYYSAAMQLDDLRVRQPGAALVPHFDRLLSFFPLHARTKPLLPVLTYLLLLQRFGDATPLAIAILIALGTLASVAAMYGAARRIAGEEVAVLACSLLALMPAVAFFFPQFDVVYPIFTCGLILTWPGALQGSRRDAALAGAIVFAMTMMSYAMLVLGAFMVLLAIFEAVRTRSARNVLTACGIAAVTILGAYLVLAALTGYPALATFRAALWQQKLILPRLYRPYPLTIPYDLLDFFLGAGWAPLLAAVALIARRERTAATNVVVAGLLTPLVVALAGLLQAETARVWIFLMPFLALPAAMEMARWRPVGRLLVAASMVVVSIALYTNMRFTFERRVVSPLPRIPAAVLR